MPGRYVIFGHSTTRSTFYFEGQAFGVVGLTRDISDVVSSIPALVETVLLPFEDVVIYGVSIAECPVSIGPGMVQIFRSELAKLEQRNDVVTSAACRARSETTPCASASPRSSVVGKPSTKCSTIAL